MATITRTTRSSMLEVIRQDYIRTARSKGVPERKVITKHALRNALIPTITVTGIEMGALLGGAILTESVFSWPGLGRLLIDSINNQNTPVVLGCLVIFAICFGIVNLIVDILYAFIERGAAHGIIGGLAVVSFVLSVNGIRLAIGGFGERDREVLPCKIGLPVSFITTVLFLAIFIGGLN